MSFAAFMFLKSPIEISPRSLAVAILRREPRGRSVRSVSSWVRATFLADDPRRDRRSRAGGDRRVRGGRLLGGRARGVWHRCLLRGFAGGSARRRPARAARPGAAGAGGARRAVG